MKQTLFVTALAFALLCGVSAFAVTAEAPAPVAASASAEEVLPVATVEATLPAAAATQCAAPAETVFADAVFANCDPWGCRALCQAKGFWDGFCILDTCVCEQGPY